MGVLPLRSSDQWLVGPIQWLREGDRCQLVIGHDGQHVLQKAGRRLTWPVGAQPQTRPPWATAFPRDEDR